MRNFVAVLFILLLATVAFASQTQLATLGFSTITLTDVQKKECQTIQTNFSDTNEVGVPVLSLQAAFDDIKSDNSYVSVQVNNETPQIIWPEFFSCTDHCWARAYLPQIRNAPASITLCLATGGKTTSAQLLDSSFIGIYDTPLISIQLTSPGEIVLGERARMSIIMTNTGTKNTELFSQFVSQDIRTLLDITSFDIVEGQSSVTTTLAAGETKQFSYTIKPNKPGTYNLPYAVVAFPNAFAEQQTITSNHPQLTVLNPEQVSVSIISTELSGGKLMITALLKNNWNKRFDGTIVFKPSDIVMSTTTTVSLEADTEREVVAYTTALAPGQYNFTAVVSDTNNNYYSNEINYPVKKEEVPFMLVFAVVAVIVAALAFYMLSMRKEKK